MATKNNNKVLIVDVEQLGLSRKKERQSGQLASKIKFTSPTFTSLKKNITTGNISALEGKYNELYNQLLEKATRKAELDSRINIAAAKQSTDDDYAIAKKEAAEIVNTIKKISSKLAKVAVKLNDLSRLELNSEGKLKTVRIVKSKSLKVPRELVHFTRRISNAEAIQNKLYASAMSLDGEVGNLGNWRSVFKDVQLNANYQKQRTVISAGANKKSTKMEQDDEIELSQNQEAELIAQYGIALNSLCKAYDSSDASMKASLYPYLKKLADEFNGLLGATIVKIPVLNMSDSKDMTPIQAQIASTVGYDTKLDKDEYAKREEFYNKFFTSPENVEQTYRMMEESYLAFFNNPEVAAKIDAAEQEDDRRKSEADLEVIDAQAKQEQDERELVNIAFASAYAAIKIDETNKIITDLEVLGHMAAVDLNNKINRGKILIAAEENAKAINKNNLMLEALRKIADEVAWKILMSSKTEEKDPIRRSLTDAIEIAMNSDSQLMRDILEAADMTAVEINSVYAQIKDMAEQTAQQIFNASEKVQNIEISKEEIVKMSLEAAKELILTMSMKQCMTELPDTRFTSFDDISRFAIASPSKAATIGHSTAMRIAKRGISLAEESPHLAMVA